MTSLGAFVSLFNNTTGELSTTPLWVDNAHKNPEKFKEWFTKHLPVYEAFNQYRIQNEWNNLLWYTGDILYAVEGAASVSPFYGYKEKARKTFPFWVSHVSDLSDKRSNDLASLKPNFETQPANAEESDRTASRVIKPALRHIRRYNGLDMLFDENERGNVVYGMSVLSIDWAKNAGDRKPEKEWAKKGEVEWEGEVEIKPILPWYLLAQPTRGVAFESSTAIQILEILNVEEARKKYKNPSIQPDLRGMLFSFASPFEADLLPDEVTIYRVIYKPDQYLPDGAVVTCLHDGTVIEQLYDNYPWSHGEFPWEIHTDISMTGKTFSYSILNYLKPLQWTYNLLGGMIKKSIFLCAHPKWMMPRGSCNIQSLGNAITVVQHKLGQAPQLVTHSPVGADTFKFRDDVKTEMRAIAGSSPLSSGEVPPNTRSGIQISRLMNIEKMNRSYQMGKRNDFMGRVLTKAASVAGDRYPLTTKQHQIRIFGKEMANDLDVLKKSKISAQYTVTIQNASGFSDDLAGRLEEVAFAAEKLPGLMTPAQQADIIGLRSSEKFYDVATAALRMAERENEAFNDGKSVPPPLFEQDHIVHWQTHVIEMQTAQHASLPTKIRERKEDHLGMHEMMMEKIAENNPLFKQQLVMLARWPLVYKPNPDLAAIQAENGAMQPAAPMPPEGNTDLSTSPEELPPPVM